MTGSGDSARLTVEGLTVRFTGRGGDTLAVNDMSLTVPEGGCVGIVGESGSGKSALCRSVVGAELRAGERRFGRITVAGQDLRGLHGRRRRQYLGRNIGFVVQESGTALNPLMRCGRQLTEHVRRHLGLGRRASLDLAAELLASLGFPDVERVLRAYPLQLSGGMRQRVIIAIALICNPRLLVADEPTTGLDVTVQARILRLLREQRRQRNMSMLVVSHDFRVVAELADEIVVMHAGSMLERGPSAAVISAPRALLTKRLMSAVDVPAGPTGGGRSDPVEGTGEREAAARSSTLPLLEAVDLRVNYTARAGGSLEALRGVSFRLRPGECVAIVGESGSGKTTLAMAALGLVARCGGAVRFLGRDITGMTGAELRRFRREVQLMPQDSRGAFNPRWTAEQVISEPLRVTAQAGRAAWSIEHALDEVTLDPAMRHRRMRTLSGGQIQRVALARVLSLQPRVLILDEPVASNDVLVQHRLVGLLGEIRSARDIAVLIISHDLSIVRSIANRLLVMFEGRVVEQGTTESVLSVPRHPYTAELLASASLHPKPPGPDRVVDVTGGSTGPHRHGCRFRARCLRAAEVCTSVDPELVELPAGGRAVACHFPMQGT